MVQISIDMNGVPLIQIDDVSSLSAQTQFVPGATIDFTGNNVTIGAWVGDTTQNRLNNVQLADFWFKAGTASNIGLPFEKRRFANRNFQMDWGPDGSGPFAPAVVLPHIFLSGTVDPTTYVQNKGVGGGFNLTGSQIFAGPPLFGEL
jgi:hypothetical protein